MTKNGFFVIVTMVGLLAISQYRCDKAPQLGKDPIKDVIAAITLEEAIMVNKESIALVPKVKIDELKRGIGREE